MKSKRFVKIYQDNKLKLYSYVLYKVKSEVVAEDIVSDVFLKLLTTVENKPEILKYVVPWLYRVASNRIIDYFRNSHYKKTNSESDLSTGHPSNDENMGKEIFIDQYNDVLSDLAKEEKEHLVIDGLEELKQKDREIIEYRLFQELPFKDIAVVLESTEGAVKMKYGRAIKKLQIICDNISTQMRNKKQ